MIPIQPAVPLEQPAGCGHCRTAGDLEFPLCFAYQPIVDIESRSIFGHEALVRGPNGEGALTVLSQVTELNRYQFDQACRVQAIKGAAELGMREKLSINFLANAVFQPDACIQSTFEAAREFGFPIENIIFEVTEGEKIHNRPHLVDIFRTYRRLGFYTAIDDFGAGYSGLDLLSEYQPHIIKLDMGLIRNIDTDRARQAILKGVIGICRALDIQLVAEGIETAAERDFLRSAGVRLMQGYLFCRPALRALGVVEEHAWG